MTLKKNLLLGVLALSALAQTPVSAPNLKKPLGVKLKIARGKAQDWFFSHRSDVVYSDKKKGDFDPKFYTEDGAPCDEYGQLIPAPYTPTMGLGYSSRDRFAPSKPAQMHTTSSSDMHQDTSSDAHQGGQMHEDMDADESVVDVKSAELHRARNGGYGPYSANNKVFSKDICAIPLMKQSGFEAPAHLAAAAMLSALIARIIEGEASIADYAKTAGYSLAGALTASALDSGTTWAGNKAWSADRTKTASAAYQIGRALQFLAFFAGQNPQVAKAIIASIKNGTAGKDFSDFILSLGKDGNQRERYAMFIRNFGPHIGVFAIYAMQQAQQQRQSHR